MCNKWSCTMCKQQDTSPSTVCSSEQNELVTLSWWACGLILEVMDDIESQLELPATNPSSRGSRWGIPLWCGERLGDEAIHHAPRWQHQHVQGWYTRRTASGPNPNSIYGSRLQHVHPGQAQSMANTRKEENVLFNKSLNTFYLHLYGIMEQSDNERGNLMPPHYGLFPDQQQGIFYLYHPTNRIVHTTAFVTSTGWNEK